MTQAELKNEALEDLSQMFLDYPNDPTPGNELLDVARLDFTIDSLVAMDEHLEVMRTQQLSANEWNKFILRAGAYVGEVIRRSALAPRPWNWLAFEEAAKVSSLVASLGKRIETVAVLWDGDRVIFPLAKVAKYIQNGAEDSVHFFAQVMSAGLPNAG